MPSTLWERGRKLMRAKKVQMVAVDPEMQVVEATVYGTYAYDVIVGVDPADDRCACPFFPEHGYCKHIAAVELYANREAGSLAAYIAQATGQPLPAVETPTLWHTHQVQSAGAELVAALGLTQPQYFHGLQASGTPLLLEATLEALPSYSDADERMPRFVLSLRVAAAADGKFYMVQRPDEFKQAYRYRQPYETNGKATFTISPEAFAAPERALLAALVTTTDSARDRLEGVSNARRYLLLAPGAITALLPLLNALAHFAYRTTDATFQQVALQPLTPDAALVTGAVASDPNGHQLTIEWHADAYLPLDHLVVRGDTAYQLDNQQELVLNLVNDQRQAQSRRGRALTVGFNAGEQEALLALVHYLAPVVTVSLPPALTLPVMTPQFALDRDEQSATLTLTYDYGETVVAEGPGPISVTPAVPGDRAAAQPAEAAVAGDAPAVTPDAPTVARNVEQERQAQAYLKALGFVHAATSWRQPFKDAAALYRFFTAELPNMRANGRVTLSPALEAMLQDGAALPPQIAVRQTDGLLAVSFAFDGIAASEVDQILAQLDTDQPYVVRPDGSLVVLDAAWTRVSQALAALRQQGAVAHGQLQVSAAQALVVQAALGDTAAFDAQFHQIVQDLTHPEAGPQPDLSGVQAELRPYQRAGVQWLEMLARHGFGGVLADEMGLGKTLQMLAFLNAHRSSGVSLVVAPASLLYNWQAECAKFCPALRVAVVDGTKAARRALIASGDYDVLITSYNRMLRDASDYAEVALQTLVLDEAQAVKNAGAKTHQALRRLTPRTTFALSGTPVENRADELWALFALVMPGLLPTQTHFRRLSPAAIALRVKPFILRREKAAVLADLPEKVETTLTNEMTKAQKTVYLAQLKQMQVQVAGLSDSGFVKNRMAILSGLTRLRQICDTPALFVPDYVGGSGKLDQLAELMQQAVDNDRHVLIFSQFTTMLDQIEARLTVAHLPFFTLKGATPAKERLTMVNAFNAGDRRFMLVSLKAGGTGLNLTGADMVILTDLWWNPAVEDQAIARAHRIGQQHQVDVYRLVTHGTIEAQILKLQAKKRDFIDQVLSGAADKAGLTAEDVRLILGLTEA